MSHKRAHANLLEDLTMLKTDELFNWGILDYPGHEQTHQLAVFQDMSKLSQDQPSPAQTRAPQVTH